MERFNEDRPMHHGCKPPKCIGKFNEKFKVYEVCCRIVVKVCSVCGFEYEPQFHHMCPRCRNHVPGGFGPGGFGFGGFGPNGFGPGAFGSGGFVRPGGYGHSGMKTKIVGELPEDEDADE